MVAGRDGQDTPAGLKVRDGLEACLVGVAEVVAYGPVEVDVYQARQGQQALGVQGFLPVHRGRFGDPALPDDQIPLPELVIRAVDPGVFE